MKLNKDKIKQYAYKGLLGSLYALNVLYLLLWASFPTIYFDNFANYYFGSECFPWYYKTKIIYAIVCILMILISIVCLYFSFKFKFKSKHLVRILILLIPLLISFILSLDDCG